MTLRALWPVTQQFQAKNGSNLVGGKVYIYYQGRTALATTYHDEEGTVVNANPVLLDNNGRATVFANTIYSYTIVVCDYYGKELFSQDITIHYDSAAAKDILVIGSDGSVKVDTAALPNGVKYDLSVNTDIIATKESVEDIVSRKQDVLTPGSNIAITNNIISATGIPTKTSELENDSGFITDVSSTVDITNIIGTISASGDTIVNILYNPALGLINMTTFNNPHRSVSGKEFHQLFLFSNDFISKVDLKLQTEIRVRDDSYNSYFTVIYLDTTGTITAHGYKGIYLWPVNHSWTVLPGNTKYFFLTQQANNELQQYVKEHL